MQYMMTGVVIVIISGLVIHLVSLAIEGLYKRSVTERHGVNGFMAFLAGGDIMVIVDKYPAR